MPENHRSNGKADAEVRLLESPGGDADVAFEQAYDAWYSPLFYLLLRLTGSEDQARDIVHDVFLRLWEKRHSIAMTDSVKSYLFAAVRNAAADLFRKRKAERNYIAGSAAVGGSGTVGDYAAPDALAASNEMELIAACAVGRMPEQRRRVFELSYRDGLSPAEIASHLGISPRSVSDHLYEARSAIQKVLPFG